MCVSEREERERGERKTEREAVILLYVCPKKRKKLRSVYYNPKNDKGKWSVNRRMISNPMIKDGKKSSKVN